MRNRGIRQINGDLILDRSAFSLPAHDPVRFDNAPLKPYNAGPDALLINLKSLRLTLRPEAGQKAPRIVVDTPDENLLPGNRLKLVDEACGDWREKFSVNVNGSALELVGNFPASCGEKTLYLSPWSADMHV